MIGIRKEMTEERDDRKALLIILPATPATTLLIFISIDSIHFHSITNINMAEPNPNPLPEPNPKPTPLLQLLRRKTAASAVVISSPRRSRTETLSGICFTKEGHVLLSYNNDGGSGDQ